MTTTTEYARLTRNEWAKAKAADDEWMALHHANAAAEHARSAAQHAKTEDETLTAQEAREEASDALQRAAMLIRFGHPGKAKD